MKTLFTKTLKDAKNVKIVLTGIALLLIISLTSYSIGQEKSDTYSDGNKSFSFKENGSDWRVYFEDNKITDLYRDGSRVPDEEVDQYRDMIYEKLDELRTDYKKYSGKVHRFYFDMDEFQEHMKKFKEDFDKDRFMKFKFKFDEEDFEKNMKELEESLKELRDKKLELYFDSEKFNEKMKELEENLKNLPKPPNPSDIDVDVYFDAEKFKEGMKKFNESIKLHKFNIDSSVFDMNELKENMKELKKNMKGLKIEISGVKGEVKKLNQFLKELKSELVNDGYLNSVDEDYSLELSDDATLVNDVSVKSTDHLKYKEIYKRIFNKEIEGKIKIEND
jgi:chromosome segregation ATPase